MKQNHNIGNGVYAHLLKTFYFVYFGAFSFVLSHCRHIMISVHPIHIDLILLHVVGELYVMKIIALIFSWTMYCTSFVVAVQNIRWAMYNVQVHVFAWHVHFGWNCQNWMPYIYMYKIEFVWIVGMREIKLHRAALNEHSMQCYTMP